jgi:hypothetical protein
MEVQSRRHRFACAGELQTMMLKLGTMLSVDYQRSTTFRRQARVTLLAFTCRFKRRGFLVQALSTARKL